LELFARRDDGVYSVSRLTQEIKERLEGTFPTVRVKGEISNFRVPASGHFYFTLKDESSQIRVVMFRSRNQALPFAPDDGMQITVRAGLSVYAPRGEYQLVAEWMEPCGRGNLQLAFEALKQRLAAEGLFDPQKKRPLPFLPTCIGLITSPTGAAVRDILKVLWRRYPNMAVCFCPVRVQGEHAAGEIAGALELLEEEGRVDVIILGRGGGSLEDLWAFNEERVARAVARTRIPVISAVGHEIDFTICDFVADLRAPTPSAAAERVVPEKAGLVLRTEALQSRLVRAAGNGVARKREQWEDLSRRLRHPGRRVQDGFLRLDDLSERLVSAGKRHFRDRRSRFDGIRETLVRVSPARQVDGEAVRVESIRRDLNRVVGYALERKRQQYSEGATRLESLSPMGVLARGYSITRRIPSGNILRDAGAAETGGRVEVVLSRGALECRVERVRQGE
jgi:exodeoxyribonuclease VII large subunit